MKVRDLISRLELLIQTQGELADVEIYVWENPNTSTIKPVTGAHPGLYLDKIYITASKDKNKPT
jgi:hypothetical protein